MPAYTVKREINIRVESTKYLVECNPEDDSVYVHDKEQGQHIVASGTIDEIRQMIPLLVTMSQEVAKEKDEKYA